MAAVHLKHNQRNSRNIKHVGINLTKEGEVLYTENYKTLWEKWKSKPQTGVKYLQSTCLIKDLYFKYVKNPQSSKIVWFINEMHKMFGQMHYQNDIKEAHEKMQIIM